jgi:acetylornithine deacetylase/succinyl-diaminopimelate desuccinylase-like protein
MRIVPDMKPEEVFKLYSDYVMSILPKGIELKVKLLSMGEPSIIPTDNRFVQAATQAMKEVFNKDTVFIRSGGSIPIVSEFDKHLKIPSVMMGFGLPDDNLHAPNEKFHIPNYYRGIESLVRFFEKLAQ